MFYRRDVYELPPVRCFFLALLLRLRSTKLGELIDLALVKTPEPQENSLVFSEFTAKCLADSFCDELNELQKPVSLNVLHSARSGGSWPSYGVNSC